MINIVQGQVKVKEVEFKRMKEVRKEMSIINMEEALRYKHLRDQLSTLAIARSLSLCISRRSVVSSRMGWYR